jgi:hypothetical protein
VVELGVRVTAGDVDATGVTDGGGVTGLDPQAAAANRTTGTSTASLKRDRVGPGVEIIISTYLPTA